MSNAWLSEKEKREMLAFALSDETSENDASILQESLMRHLHLTSKNIEENDDVDDTSRPVEEEKYVFENFFIFSKISQIFVFPALSHSLTLIKIP